MFEELSGVVGQTQEKVESHLFGHGGQSLLLDEKVEVVDRKDARSLLQQVQISHELHQTFVVFAVLEVDLSKGFNLDLAVDSKKNLAIVNAPFRGNDAGVRGRLRLLTPCFFLQGGGSLLLRLLRQTETDQLFNLIVDVVEEDGGFSCVG